MQGVILAAGKGMRLGDRRGRPKCMQEVGGLPLVHYQLSALADVGVDDVVMVVGFGQDQIRRSVGAAARYQENLRFTETNSMCSFLLARDQVDEDVLVLNSDLFFHPALLERLTDREGDALLYDSGSGDEDEHMKVRVERGRLVEMSKTMPQNHVCGENVGLLRLTASTFRDTAATAHAIAAGGGEQAWLAAAVNCVAIDHPIRCVDVRGWPWVEIDFPEDLVRARAEVFPSVSDAYGLGDSGPADLPAMLGGPR